MKKFYNLEAWFMRRCGALVAILFKRVELIMQFCRGQYEEHFVCSTGSITTTIKLW